MFGTNPPLCIPDVGSCDSEALLACQAPCLNEGQCVSSCADHALGEVVAGIPVCTSLNLCSNPFEAPDSDWNLSDCAEPCPAPQLGVMIEHRPTCIGRLDPCDGTTLGIGQARIGGKARTLDIGCSTSCLNDNADQTFDDSSVDSCKTAVCSLLNEVLRNEAAREEGADACVDLDPNDACQVLAALGIGDGSSNVTDACGTQANPCPIIGDVLGDLPPPPIPPGATSLCGYPLPDIASALCAIAHDKGVTGTHCEAPYCLNEALGFVGGYNNAACSLVEDAASGGICTDYTIPLDGGIGMFGVTCGIWCGWKPKHRDYGVGVQGHDAAVPNLDPIVYGGVSCVLYGAAAPPTGVSCGGLGQCEQYSEGTGFWTGACNFAVGPSAEPRIDYFFCDYGTGQQSGGLLGL